MLQKQDATAYQLSVQPPFKRVVSLVPSQTELLLDLGVAVVGRTRFCLYPSEQVKQIQIVGGTKDFKPDKIRALQPDLILANLEENVPEPLLALREDIPVWTTQVRDLPEALKMIQDVGWLTGKQSEAETLAVNIHSGFLQLQRHAKALRCVYLIWREPWMTVGGDTFIHDLLTRCGLNNLTGIENRYPSLDDQSLKDLDPDLILLSSEPYPFKAKHIPEIQKLCPRAKIKLVDGSFFSWYGSRLKQAIVYFQQLEF